MKTLKILLIITVIPFCSLFSSLLFESSFERMWQQDLLTELGEEAKELPIFNLEFACNKSDFVNEIKEFCEYPIYSYYFRNLSIICIFIALFLILYIEITSFYSQKNRNFLIRSFKLGAYLCLFSISILVLFYGISIVLILYYIESELFGIIHFYILGLIGVGAFVVSLNLIKSSFNLLKPIQININAVSITERDDNFVYKILLELSKQINSTLPENIFIGVEPMFFVTESNVISNDKNVFDSKSLYISSPILRFLNINEFKGILAHELAHFSGEDTKFAKDFFPIYHGMFDSLQNSIVEVEGGIESISMFPLFSLLNYFFNSYSESIAIISRSRELRADRIASEYVGNDVYGSALVKVYAYTELWDEMYLVLIEDIKNGVEIDNIEEYFLDFISNSDKINEMMLNIDKYNISHPIDSHPNLIERFKNLNLNLEAIISKIDLKSKKNDISKFIKIDENINDFTNVEIERIKYFNI